MKLLESSAHRLGHCKYCNAERDALAFGLHREADIMFQLGAFEYWKLWRSPEVTAAWCSLLLPDYSPLSVSSFLTVLSVEIHSISTCRPIRVKSRRRRQRCRSYSVILTILTVAAVIRTRRSRAATTLAYPSLSPIINWIELVRGGKVNIVDFVAFSWRILHVLSSHTEIFIRTLKSPFGMLMHEQFPWFFYYVTFD